MREVTRDINKIREWILEQIRVKQKPELDKQVGGIEAKKLLKRKVLSSLKKGRGASFGRRLGRFARRLGRSVARIFGF